MSRRAVLTSYSIVAASALALITTRVSFNYYYPGYSDPFTISFITIPAIAGLIMGPYFGLAALIVKEESVWAGANRLIHEHISVPFIGGIALWYGSIFPLGLVSVLVVYGLFVFLATLMGVMATKPAKASASAQTSS